MKCLGYFSQHQWGDKDDERGRQGEREREGDTRALCTITAGELSDPSSHSVDDVSD